jgi:polysaccharide deacetylase family protein (PEP-CTERM system associated)
VLTVSLEDYFHVGAFGSLIPRAQWYRFESRIEQSAERMLDLLDEFGVSATVFVLGCVAERFPELVRSVRDRGHEIASKGYQHRLITEMTASELADDLTRAREAIERASGQRIVGCRVSGWLTPQHDWALEVMAEQGYLYDSSMRPLLRSHVEMPHERRAHLHTAGVHRIWEFPVSSVSVLGCDIPLAGGNWMRQLPHALVRRGIDSLHRDVTAPMVLYFQTWELDPEQPRIDAASWSARVRHYRNLDRMPERLRHYLGRYEFGGISDWLGVPVTDAPRFRAASPIRLVPTRRAPAIVPPARSLPRLAVSVVIPCYNEERALPYLANTLRRLEETLGAAYDLRFVFVDDGSEDGTPGMLRKLFADWANVSVLRHSRNRGVFAAIDTGLLAATTEIVCSMGCDCAHDPLELARMIPRLRLGVDLVIASPYHPEGVLPAVGAWRLAMSRALAAMYRLVLTHQLHTYTNCFRVYRRSRMLAIATRRTGPVGLTESLARLDMAGGAIVEHPVRLEARIFGRSKMSVVRSVAGHLGLLAELAWCRFRGRAVARRDVTIMDDAPASQRVAPEQMKDIHPA